MSKPVMLSAIKPNNSPTLGNYIGAIRQWVKAQKDNDCYFFAVDLHSITLKQDPKLLRDRTYTAIAAYLAAGIDPNECKLFIQSHVSEHAELSWVLNCHSHMGELNRMTQFKDKSASQGKNIPAGLFTYPVLMAADILLYDTQVVPVGEDQKQHIELTRDLAIRMNHLYGEDTVVVPEPVIPKEGARIMNLQDPSSKMGKSNDQESGVVFLIDSDKDILKKLKRAVTDSGENISFDPKEKAGVSNLITIYSCLSEMSVTEVVNQFQGKKYGHLKVETGELLVEKIRPIREKIEEYLNDKGELDRILKVGADRAREKAQKTLARVYDRLGFVLRKP